MKLVKPKKLLKGDVIGIISPASSTKDNTRIEKGVKYLEKLGYRVEVGKNVGKTHGYLAGTDEERLDDLHSMFENKNVKAIINVRGGYGSGKLLDKIDYSLIKKNPKIFVGYSDITALQMAFLKKTGLVTFAGPMLAVDFWKDEVNAFTEENFWNMITSTKKIGKLQNPDNENFYTLTKGRGEGNLIGGNLALFSSLLGTPYLPDFKNSVLMFEEIGEEPYRIDRMFYQIKFASNNFKDVEGVIIGRFVDCYIKDKESPSLTLNDVISDYFEQLKIPIIYNVKHGHIEQNLTIPWGLKVKLNASRNFIEIAESAVI
ncbi:MAG: LD-carboxypeptidase [Bacteroidetes bacterium]|nr:LD-carboxypeptidase [Bacteroidota bacterium]MBU1116374.1 LD-carboxypeptidase [Bacteroidota bacterium]MBU1800398.1 LD-carboxypeptidase [Bacteroidota bacterium]